MSGLPELYESAKFLAERLRQCDRKVVFAESCTGGLVSSVVTAVAGVSDVMCGSTVVYRIETKAEWLGISRDLLDDPGPVSEIVARLMAEGVLAKTPEATVAASVTGHVGPFAPEDQDGLVFIGVAGRNREPEVFEYRLERTPDDANESELHQLRIARQMTAAKLVLESVLSFVTSA
ncbi:CinA family protein [Thalassoroseus pseudoceratinae]|uniref:CinA family protein n=1 Tax=Thalassoroseus pseudoceratinae TaxID=2713176 RepID=UPI001421301B|nr:CinA family protein [Thalassoroseus pseudoceratinae]